MTSIPGDFANARLCCVDDDDCNHNLEVVNEIDTLPELPKDISQRIRRKLYKKNGRKCIWYGKRVFYKICQYEGCVKQTKKKKKYCHVCNQTIEIENIDIDDIENRIKTQDNIKLSDLIKDRYGKWLFFKNHIIYGLWLENKLGYETEEYWYNITREQIHNNGGRGLLSHYYNDSPQEFVMTVFPDYDWDPSKFNKHKTEAIVEKFLRTYYQIETQKIFEWCKNIRCLPFDFYIEELKIIIELDGAQHFRQVANWVSPEEQQQNDIYKMKKALDQEISVIRILQEDVYYDRIKWQEEIKNKIEVIKQTTEPTIQYICSNNEYEKHKELYENHE